MNKTSAFIVTDLFYMKMANLILIVHYLCLTLFTGYVLEEIPIKMCNMHHAMWYYVFLQQSRSLEFRFLLSMLSVSQNIETSSFGWMHCEISCSLDEVDSSTSFSCIIEERMYCNSAGHIGQLRSKLGESQSDHDSPSSQEPPAGSHFQSRVTV